MATALTEKTFQFELVSPEKILSSEEVRMVNIPGDLGEFGVLADHAPLLSSLRPGVVTVTTLSGDQKKIFVGGGFADVNNNVCAVLAEDAVNVEDIDTAALKKQVDTLKDDLGFANDDAEKAASIRKEIEQIEFKLMLIA